jgi:hypothetical protein
LPAQDFHYHFTPAEDCPLATIEKEYEGGASLTIAGGFMTVG